MLVISRVDKSGLYPLIPWLPNFICLDRPLLISLKRRMNLMIGTQVLERQDNNEEKCKISGFSAFDDKDG